MHIEDKINGMSQADEHAALISRMFGDIGQAVETFSTIREKYGIKVSAMPAALIQLEADVKSGVVKLDQKEMALGIDALVRQIGVDKTKIDPAIVYRCGLMMLLFSVMLEQEAAAFSRTPLEENDLEGDLRGALLALEKITYSKSLLDQAVNAVKAGLQLEALRELDA
jgi:hypothetical protein